MFSILVGIFYPFAEAVFSKEGVFQQPRDLSSIDDISTVWGWRRLNVIFSIVVSELSGNYQGLRTEAIANAWLVNQEVVVIYVFASVPALKFECLSIP
jgi:hypothetical protein